MIYLAFTFALTTVVAIWLLHLVSRALIREKRLVNSQKVEIASLKRCNQALHKAHYDEPVKVYDSVLDAEWLVEKE